VASKKPRKSNTGLKVGWDSKGASRDDPTAPPMGSESDVSMRTVSETGSDSAAPTTDGSSDFDDIPGGISDDEGESGERSLLISKEKVKLTTFGQASRHLTVRGDNFEFFHNLR